MIINNKGTYQYNKYNDHYIHNYDNNDLVNV